MGFETGFMQGNSSQVRSRQHDIHPRLRETVYRHLASPWLAPVHEPTRRALMPVLADIVDSTRPVILDAGCGDGASTLRLAYRHPRALVVGLDKSAARLQRLAPGGSARRGNVWLARADIAEAWRLFAEAGVRLAGHYLLYPNPWPKSTHLHRRWHGHPAFRWLLALGGWLELRSNWPIYVAEFGHALRIARRRFHIEQIDAALPALTPFERKYRESGHELWQLISDLDAGVA